MLIIFVFAEELHSLLAPVGMHDRSAQQNVPSERYHTSALGQYISILVMQIRFSFYYP